MIDVHCGCGKVYRVPADKAGRKLQCKRCGAVRRVPHLATPDSADLEVPFRSPGAMSDDDGLGLAGGLPLDLRVPLRRCPCCGFQDDADIVLCVRCGYDWRVGRRMEDAHEAGERSDRLRAVASADAALGDLGRLAWVALSPLGLLLGPYVFARSLAMERRLRALGRDLATLQHAQQIRVMAGAGTAAWLLVASFFAAFALREGRDDGAALAVACEARLERIGRAVRGQLGARPWPGTDRTLHEALRGLSEGSRAPLAPSDLRCPLAGDLYAYVGRATEELTPQVDPGYLVLWDRERHADALGQPSFRALRADGTVERFASREALDAARARPPFPSAAPAAATGGAGEGSGAAGSADATPTPSAAWPAIAERLGAFAQECDAIDPHLLSGLAVDLPYFFERVGAPAEAALDQAFAQGSPALRAAAARMVARVALPPARKRAFAERLLEEDAPELRLAGALALRRLADRRWLDAVAEATASESAAARAEGLRILGAHAAEGAAGTAEVLDLAREVRARLGARGDDPMFALPPEALPHVATLLADRALGREARAVLYGAGRVGREATLAALASDDPALRGAAFEVLDLLRQRALVPLSDYLEHVDAEVDADVRAAALERVAADDRPVPAELLDWALGCLRGRPPAPVRAQCARLLARVGRGPDERSAAELERLVRDLAAEGDPSAVLAELGAPTRALDVRLDQLLAAHWRSFQAPTRRDLAELLGHRPTPEAVEALLAAVGDADATTRDAALAALARSPAPIEDPLRHQIAEALARLIPRLDSPVSERIVYELASGATFCAVLADEAKQGEHRCTPTLLRALRKRVERGDRAALRCFRTHRNWANVEALVTLLDTRDDTLRGAVNDALVQMTNHQRYYGDAAQARDVLAREGPRIRGALAANGLRELGTVRRWQEAARRRLEQARARGRD